MSYTPIQKGAINWDVPVNAAFTDQDTRIDSNSAHIEALERPYVQRNLVGWSLPVELTAGATAPGTNGQLYMVRVDITKTSVATGVNFGFSAPISGPVAGQNLVGLYDSGGNLIAQTVDQSTNFANVDLITSPFTSPITLLPGSYYVSFLLNATTRPSMLRGLSVIAFAETLNIGQSISTAGWATTGAGLTALPSSVNMATRSKAANAWWVALY